MLRVIPLLAAVVAVSARDSWYHPEDHPVARLFRRDSTPAVGSPAWTALYPDPATFPPKPESIPKAWMDSYNAAVSQGLIPNVPIPTKGASGSPVYPNNEDPTDKTICSATYECRATGDIWDAPAGTVGLSFDDGPLPPSPTLYKYLKDNNQHATHFFIGSNILYNSQIFLQAYQDNQDDIAVHTWTHPYMTMQSNVGVLAELGWTLQIIHDSTGGRIPRFWRPPFGDVDNRVRAIAAHVFGLTTVIWNQDSEDWELTNNAIPLSKVEASLKSFYSMPKSPGLVILEHELSTESVQAFMTSYPLLKQNGWTAITIPDIAGMGGDFYQNAHNNTGAVSAMSVGAGNAANNASGSSASGSASASASASASGAPSASVSASGSASSPSASGSKSGSSSASASSPSVSKSTTLASSPSSSPTSTPKPSSSRRTYAGVSWEGLVSALLIGSVAYFSF